MRQMEPVLWTKGVLLTPQHLQSHDRFFEDQLAFRLAALAPWGWGLQRLQIDRDALAGGVFALTRAAAVFPDGLPYDAPDADPLPERRPLGPVWPGERPTLDVFLAVPRARRGERAVSQPADGQGTRYLVDVAMVRDETTGVVAERPVLVGRKNVRLLCEGEALDGHDVLRLARVRRAADGGYELDPGVTPPLVDLAASDELLAMARRLAERLAARGAALAGDRRPRNSAVADFGPAEIEPFWLLYTVNAALPVVRHVAETRQGHPEPLFAAMLALAGALETFAAEPGPPLPAYDHADPGRCFAALDARVRALLETAIAVGAVSLPLRVVRPSIHAATFDDERHADAPQLYLAVAADMPLSELIQRVPQVVKCGSPDVVDALVRQALPGVPLAHVASPGGAVRVKLDHQYFALARSGAAWDSVRRARSLAAYVPADLPNARLELVVVLPGR